MALPSIGYPAGDTPQAPEQNLAIFLSKSKVKSHVAEILIAYQTGLTELNNSLEEVESILQSTGGKFSPTRILQKGSSLSALGFLTASVLMKNSSQQAKMRTYAIISGALSSVLTLVAKPNLNQQEAIETLNQSILNVTDAIDADAVDQETREKSLELLSGLIELKKGLEDTGRPWQEKVAITQLVSPISHLLLVRMGTFSRTASLMKLTTTVSTVGIATMDIASIATEDNAKLLIPKIQNLRLIIQDSQKTLREAIQYYKRDQ